MICEKCGKEIDRIWQINQNTGEKSLEPINEDGEQVYFFVSDEWAENTKTLTDHIQCPYCLKFPVKNEHIKQEKFRSIIMTRDVPNLDEAERIIKKQLGSLDDCLMPITKYREYVKTGCITDYDGSGCYYDIWGSEIGPCDFNIADIDQAIANGIPFVAWFNK